MSTLFLPFLVLCLPNSPDSDLISEASNIYEEWESLYIFAKILFESLIESGGLSFKFPPVKI